MIGQPFHSLGAEQIGGVEQFARDSTLIAAAQEELQIESRTLRAFDQILRLQAGQASQGGSRPINQLKHALYQWITAGFAFGRNRLHHLLEREILMPVGRDRGIANLGQ